MADHLQTNNFTAGELAPTLAARVDLAKYSQGCASLLNFKVNPHGGAYKRAGLLLLDELPGDALLFPFVFNQSQAYCLAFMERRMRVYAAEGPILKDGEPYEIDSPYTLENARDLSFVQSADTLFLACWAVRPTRLIRRAHDDWEFEPMEFGPPLASPQWKQWVSYSPIPRFTEIANSPLLTRPGSDPDGEPYDDPARRFKVIDQSPEGVRGEGAEPGDGSPPFPWNQDDIELDELSVRSVTVQTPGYPGTAAVYSVGVQFVNGAVKSDGTGSPAQLTTPLSYYVSAVSAEGKESELSEAAEITGPGSNNWQGGDYVHMEWEAAEGAVSYRIYKAEYHGRPGFIGSTTGLTYVDHNIVASISEGAPKYVDPFPEEGGYPGVVGLFEQRLVLASTPASPQSIWFSKSGDYGNFAVYEPLMDDSSIQLTVASSEMSSFAWLSALRSMIVGTASMEWEISAQTGAFTVKTAKATPQSYIGSSKLPPILVGNSLLHVSRAGNTVRNLKYDFGSDSYGGTDLSILANHLFRAGGIVDWCYQKHPDSIIWCVGQDGSLCGLTYMEDHQIAAWHRHSTRGEFRSVASLPGAGEDRLFAVVRRGGRHWMEIQAPEDLRGDFKRAVYLDSALLYEGPPASSLSGLDHLEGQEVGILADGAVLGRKTVSGGRLELESPASIAVVGLPYESVLESMPIELAQSQGHSLGKTKTVKAAHVEFHETMGGFVGVKGHDLMEIKARRGEPFGEAPQPFTGLNRVVFPSDPSRTIQIRVVHGDPVPAKVLAVVPEVGMT